MAFLGQYLQFQDKTLENFLNLSTILQLTSRRERKKRAKKVDCSLNNKKEDVLLGFIRDNLMLWTLASAEIFAGGGLIRSV